MDPSIFVTPFVTPNKCAENGVNYYAIYDPCVNQRYCVCAPCTGGSANESIEAPQVHSGCKMATMTSSTSTNQSDASCNRGVCVTNSLDLCQRFRLVNLGPTISDGTHCCPGRKQCLTMHDLQTESTKHVQHGYDICAVPNSAGMIMRSNVTHNQATPTLMRAFRQCRGVDQYSVAKITGNVLPQNIPR